MHCSAGVGRSGTYIAIDYLLEMAKTEKKVNLYNFTRRMRDQRVTMIQVKQSINPNSLFRISVHSCSIHYT